MEVPSSLATERLLLETITLDDNKFILELVNTEGWLRFIGNRNLHSSMQVSEYIQNITDSPKVTYWVVRLKDSKTKIGVITFIKRDFLDHPDIGFAFLPAYNNNGYAFEASNNVLNNLKDSMNLPYILATTIPENTNSIKLLTKLGLNFEREMEHDNTILHIYGMSCD